LVDRHVKPEVVAHERQARAMFVEAHSEDPATPVAPVVQRLEIALVAQEAAPVVTFPQVVLIEQAQVEVADEPVVAEPVIAEEPVVLHFNEPTVVEVREAVKPKFASASEAVPATAAKAVPVLHAQTGVRVQRMMVWEASIKQRARAAAPVVPSAKAVAAEPVATSGICVETPATSKAQSAMEPVVVTAASAETSVELEPIVATADAAPSPMTVLAPEAGIELKDVKLDTAPPAAETVAAEAVRFADASVADVLTDAVREPWQPNEATRAVVVPWAPRPERRRAPRVLQYPQGLARNTQPASTRRDLRSGVVTGAPRMTPAEQAVAQSISRRKQQASTPPAETRTEPVATPEPRRWGLLSRFDTELPNARLMTRELETKDRAAAG